MRRSTQNNLIVFAFLAPSLFLTPVLASAESYVTILSALDGDSLVTKNGSEIRLFGVDCPEFGQPFAEEARRFTRRSTAGVRVRLEEITRDIHGRTVARVFLPDGRDLGAELVRQGYAWWFRKYAPDRTDLKALEAEARAAGRGLWSDHDPVPPWRVRWEAGKTSALAGPESQSGTIYRGNRRSHVFHRPECKDYRCRNCTAVFQQREEAIEAGYRPCKQCNP